MSKLNATKMQIMRSRNIPGNHTKLKLEKIYSQMKDDENQELNQGNKFKEIEIN